MPLQDRIVVNVQKTTQGWIVATQDGTVHGPFESEYDMGHDPTIGQRALNWLTAQGNRTSPRFMPPGGFV